MCSFADAPKGAFSLTVLFDRALPHRVDVTEFQSRLGECLDSGSLTALDAAAALYRDEFLAGLTLVGAPDFESWVHAQREELRGQFVQVLQAQVQLSLSEGAWNAGIAPAPNAARAMRPFPSRSSSNAV